MSVKLSILDQSPMSDTETAADAFQHTIELARKAEEWGYHRFWVAEHHGSNKVAGSSPEVLMSHLLAKTSHIRVGSGGVMLQHYSPYKVAENFNVLSTLAPGRVDLGIGRGPGGQPRSTQALRQTGENGGVPLPDKLTELEKFLHNRLEETHPLHGLQTTPVPPQPADLYMLGTTPSSADLAAERGMPYVFALFLNQDEAVMAEAVERYRSQFDTRRGTQPQTILALPVVAADTDEEAQLLATDLRMVRVVLESGRSYALSSMEAAEEFGRQSQENYSISLPDTDIISGSQETVRHKLMNLQREYQVDELFIVTNLKQFQQRLHSYELLGEILAPVTV